MGEFSFDFYNRCGCGIPNRAAYYVRLVITRDVDGGSETSYVDWYACADHCDDLHPEAMLNPEIAAQGWQVIESEFHELARR